jgi:hypothetical protein
MTFISHVHVIGLHIESNKHKNIHMDYGQVIS